VIEVVALVKFICRAFAISHLFHEEGLAATLGAVEVWLTFTRVQVVRVKLG